MLITRNPRKGNSFENNKQCCSICEKVNTYFVSVQPYLFCKGCLTNMIAEIDSAIITDLKRCKKGE